MEDRNLRSLHNSPDMFTSKPRPASLQGTLQDGNSPILNVSNQRYLNVGKILNILLNNFVFPFIDSKSTCSKRAHLETP